MTGWDPSAPGVLELPSGRLVRGRALGRGAFEPADARAEPTFGVYFAALPLRTRRRVRWDHLTVIWPDFALPPRPAQARRALLTAWQRSTGDRVELGCRGGRGRTGTGLACLAALDGLDAQQAVALVRAHYHPGAVETAWQRRYVRQFADAGPGAGQSVAPG